MTGHGYRHRWENKSDEFCDPYRSLYTRVSTLRLFHCCWVFRSIVCRPLTVLHKVRLIKVGTDAVGMCPGRSIKMNLLVLCYPVQDYV